MEKGFTLTELMIVVSIIGVLSAIAIPQFNEYRSRSNDTVATVDARNAINAMAAAQL